MLDQSKERYIYIWIYTQHRPKDLCNLCISMICKYKAKSKIYCILQKQFST